MPVVTVADLPALPMFSQPASRSSMPGYSTASVRNRRPRGAGHPEASARSRGVIHLPHVSARAMLPTWLYS